MIQIKLLSPGGHVGRIRRRLRRLLVLGLGLGLRETVRVGGLLLLLLRLTHDGLTELPIARRGLTVYGLTELRRLGGKRIPIRGSHGDTTLLRVLLPTCGVLLPPSPGVLHVHVHVRLVLGLHLHLHRPAPGDEQRVLRADPRGGVEKREARQRRKDPDDPRGEPQRGELVHRDAKIAVAPRDATRVDVGSSGDRSVTLTLIALLGQRYVSYTTQLSRLILR